MVGENRSRRSFLDLLLGTSVFAWLGAVIFPVLRFLTPPRASGEAVGTVLVGPEDDFPPDSGKVIKFGREPGLVLRRADGTYRAFLATCTHLACIVQYRRDLGVIWCACHNGRYDLDGRNISGPPPRPLDELRVEVRDGDVFVSRMA